jgi:hypothetical protein
VPDPDEPLVMVSHDAPLDAVHVQPVVVVTVKVDDPPPVANEAEVGVSVKLHEAAACVTVTVLPAIVTVPVRDVVAVLLATESDTVPLPAPEAPEVTVIQGVLLDAVQLQPVVPVTVAVKGPPDEVAEVDVGDTL